MFRASSRLGASDSHSYQNETFGDVGKNSKDIGVVALKVFLGSTYSLHKVVYLQMPEHDWGWRYGAPI